MTQSLQLSVDDELCSLPLFNKKLMMGRTFAHHPRPALWTTFFLAGDAAAVKSFLSAFWTHAVSATPHLVSSLKPHDYSSFDVSGL
jgi:hypothetical protein